MLVLKPCKNYYQYSSFLSTHFNIIQKLKLSEISNVPRNKLACRRKLRVKGSSIEGESSGEKKKERRTFLSLEEAGLVEMSGLSTHERFLCRLTV